MMFELVFLVSPVFRAFAIIRYSRSSWVMFVQFLSIKLFIFYNLLPFIGRRYVTDLRTHSSLLSYAMEAVRDQVLHKPATKSRSPHVYTPLTAYSCLRICHWRAAKIIARHFKPLLRRYYPSQGSSKSLRGLVEVREISGLKSGIIWQWNFIGYIRYVRWVTCSSNI